MWVDFEVNLTQFQLMMLNVIADLQIKIEGQGQGFAFQLRDFPCFFHYLNFVHEVDEVDLLTEIYLPIK
ncbi:hypothetical protein ATY36_09555 [Vibrio cidicii]|nr:hypothetical protein ATY36_09555 [Vibrio cidicii]